MTQISGIYFDDAVTSLFKQVADRSRLELQKLPSGIYQIAGGGFVLRMRLGLGHLKDVLVTLAPVTEVPRDLDHLTGEIGLNNIAEYYGLAVPDQDTFSVKGFYSSLRRVAEIAETVCMPHLAGQKSDYADIRAFVDRKIETTRKQWGPWPSNVREEWLE
jgi:hypothetical protein